MLALEKKPTDVGGDDIIPNGKRKWERERRNRLCAAFAALADVLPSTPSTATKIAILHLAVNYIKELHAKNARLVEAESKYPTNISILLDKLSLLEERCSQLIQHMQQNGVPLSSSLLLNTKGITEVNPLSNFSSKNENTTALKEGDAAQKVCIEIKDIQPNDQTNIADKNLEESSVNSQSATVPNKEIVSNDDSIKSYKKVILKKSLKKRAKRKFKVKKSSNIENSMLKNNSVNNVWLSNHNQNGSIIVGNMLLPMMPKVSPMVVPSTPPAPTILFLQRPLVQNHQGIVRDSTFDNNMPLTKHLMSPSPYEKQVSQIYGFDVTKTTMVNKMPIPAISSTAPMIKLENVCQSNVSLRVSYRNQRKLFKSLKTPKKFDSMKSEVEKGSGSKVITKERSGDTNFGDKITPVTCDENNTLDEKSKSTENVNKERMDKLSTVDMSLVNVEKQIELRDNNEDLSKNIVNKKQTSSVDNPSSEMNKTNPNSLITGSPVEELCQNVDLSLTRNYAEKTVSTDPLHNNENKCSDASKSLPIDNAPKCADLQLKKTIVQDSDPKAINLLDAMKQIKESDSVVQKPETVQHPSNVDCRIQLNKSIQSNNILSTSELPEDLLASFVTPAESTMATSPLTSSPLATSPTAAFLLAFPLVCPGPRPDTPLNESLPAPNICSLDNFSNFFVAKDASGANILPLGNNHIMYTECLSKQLPQFIHEKSKSFWVSSHNNQIFTKPPNMSKCEETKTTDKLIGVKQSIVSSSNCVYSNPQDNYITSKAATINNQGQFAPGETLFTYDQSSVINVPKEQQPVNAKQTPNISSKSTLHYELLQNASSKNKHEHNLNQSGSLDCFNVPTNVCCNNLKTQNYGLLSSSMADSKKNSNNESTAKVIFTTASSTMPIVTKNSEVPFTVQSQGKTSYSNSSNMYTSCNTYNPFSTDFSSNSVNLSLSCGNGRMKANTYYSEFNSANVCSQNTWMEENQTIFNQHKNDQSKKLNNSSSNQNSGPIVFPNNSLILTSKCSDKQLPDNKNSKNIKYVGKDVKYISGDKHKIEGCNQKGPVNWMTSDVIAQSNNDMYYPNYKEIKTEQSSMIPHSNQTCLEPISNIGSVASFNCKKPDMFDQPFFPLPTGGYSSQVTTEDNQFTWSPSKLTSGTYADNNTLPPCSLPTLVGDLALGIISEPKLAYPPVITEQQDAVKDRKALQKNKDSFVGNKPNEVNPSHIANYFSVSHLMERSKINENSDSNKVCAPQDMNKRSTAVENGNRNFNPQLSKAYESITCGVVQNFPSENYAAAMQNSSENSKNFTNKVDNNNVVAKPGNKNNYSTEALLQNDNHPHYQNHRKQKPNVQKLYSENAGYSIHGNQFMATNHPPLTFDNFTQNQQYAANTFPYSTSAVSMNSTFYSTSNLIPSSNMSSSNYINTGFPTDLNDYQNAGENIFFTTKTENCKNQGNEYSKYTFKPSLSSTVATLKDTANKNKSDGCTIKKDLVPPNKRQKKGKQTYQINYAVPPDRCFGSVSNQTASPVGIDDSYFGYPGQGVASFPPQASLLQHTGQHMQKGNFPAKLAINTTNMTSSPNPVGTSLTNFNLSTIFPEINKRTSMIGFNDAHQLPNHALKPPPTGMFNNM